MEVGNITFGVRFDDNSIEQALSALKSKFSDQKDLVITPKTKEDALTGLNKHLDIKKKHLKEIVDFYKNSPIEPVFKDTYSEFEKKIERLRSETATQQRNDLNESNKPQTVRQEASQVFKVKEEIDPLKSIVGGAFEQIGSSFSKQFTGSFIKSVEQKVGITLKDAGKYTGQFATHIWDSKFNSNYYKASQENENQKSMGVPIEFRTPVPEYLSPKKAGAYTANLAMQLWDQHTTPSSQKESNNAEKLHKENQKVSSQVSQLFGQTIDNSVNSIRSEIKKNTGDIGSTKQQFERIRKGFSDAYKQMNSYLENGNIDLAKAHAKVIIEMSAKAKEEIDKIKSSLAAEGTPVGFGKELSSLAGSTKGVIESNYNKPAQRLLNKIDHQEAEEYGDQEKSTLEIGMQTLKGVSLGLTRTSEVENKAAGIALKILVSMKKELGIQSPSKKGDWIGQQFIAGIVQGIERGGKSIDDVAEKISKKIVSVFTAKMPNLPTETGILPDPDLSEEEEKKQLKKRNRLRYAGIRGKASEQRKYIKAGFIPQNSEEWQEFDPGSREYFDLQFNRFGKRFQRDVGGKFASQAGEHGEKVSSNAISREIAGAIASAGILTAPAQMGMAALSPLAIPLAPSAITGMMVNNLLSPIFAEIGKSITRIDPIINKYTAISGSKEAGANELNYVRGVTSKYAVGLEGASDQYASLSAAAKGTKLEGEGVKNLFEGIAASTRAMNLGTYDSTLVFNAYTQILGKGKLSMEELRQQLAEKFPQAMTVFADAMGVSVPELQAMIGKGAILSEDILPKVAIALKSKFGDAAKGASESFTGSIAKLDNAKFDLGAKLVEGFGGMYTAINNIMAGVVQKVADNWKQIQTVITTLLIGLAAQVAVAFEMIFSSPQISKVTGVLQNFLSSAFSKSIYALTPFIAGMFVDLFDDAMGSKRNVIQNMSMGITQAITGVVGQIDFLSRAWSGSSIFTPQFSKEGAGSFLDDLSDKLESINVLGVSIGGVAKSFKDFFGSIAGGTGEFVALIVMFEQLAVLGAHFVKPTFDKIKAAVVDMAMGITKAFTSFENITLSFNNFLAVTLQQSSKIFGQLVAKLAFFSAEAAVAIGVMMLAQSDFADPLATEMNKSKQKVIDDVGGIKKSLNELKNVGVDTATGISKAFNSMNLAQSLPSKGIELNLKKVFGLEDESKSYKSDDFFKDLNRAPKSDDNLLLKFVRLFPEDREADGTNKQAREMKEKADKVGVGKFFTGERHTTIAQQQLYNKAFDNDVFIKDLRTNLQSQNLTPDTIQNFSSGKIGEQISKIQDYDRILEKLGNKRVKAALIDTSESKLQVREIDKDIKKVLEDRKLLQRPLGQAFDFLNNAQSELENQIGTINKSDLPFEAKQALLAPLEEQKQEIDKTVEYIKKSGLSKVSQPLEEIWSKVVSNLRDADTLFEKLTNRQKIEDLQTQTNIYSKGATSETTKSELDAANVTGLEKTKNGLEAILEIRKKALERLLSVSDINANDERKKEIEELRKNITKDTTDLAQTKEQIAQAQNEMYNKLREQAKAVKEYFQSISDSAKEKEIEYKKLKNTLKADVQQSKLRSILSDGFDTIMTQYIEAISSIMEKESERSNRKYDLEAGILKSKQETRNTLKQGDDLIRQLPSDQSVAIVLDTSSLKNDLNVQALNDDLNSAVDLQGKFSTKLNSTRLAFDDNVMSADELLGKLQRISPLLDVAKEKIDQNTVATRAWDTGLKGLIDSAGTLQGKLNSVGGVISKNIASTAEWVENLSSGSNLLKTVIKNAPALGQAATKIGTDDPQNKPNVFGMLGNLAQGKGVYGNGGLNKSQINVAPIEAVESISGRKVTTGRTTADIEVHHPSRGNTRESSSRDYQMIDGKLEEVDRGKGGIPLIKKDMVLSRNGNKNVEIPAFASGYVSNVGEGVGRVRIRDKDGNMLGESLHMTGIKVKNGDYVQYGQPLGTQGGVGVKGDNTYAQHLHSSMSKEMWSNYIRDFNDGGFDTNSVNCQMCGATNHNATQHKQLANDKFSQAVASGKGGNGWIGESTPKNTATLERTGVKNKSGLENLTLTVGGEQFTVHSGKPNTQNMFGDPGTTKEGSKAPLEYGSYEIKSPIPGMSAGVGKTFLPISPNFKTNRKDLGIHNDADINIDPGSAGCLVFDTPEQLTRFQALIGKGGIDKLDFRSPKEKQKQIVLPGGGKTNVDKLQSYQVTDLETGKVISSKNADQRPNASASTIKLLIADVLLDALKAGTVKLGDLLKANVGDIAEGSGMKPGSTQTVKTSLNRMLSESDNTSSNLLISALGGIDAVNAAIQKKYKNSKLGNKFSIPGGKSFMNETTAQDTSSAMFRIFQGDREENNIAKSALGSTRNFGYKGEIGGKIGNNSKVTGDVGLANVEGKKYIITTFVNKGDSPESRKIIKSATNELEGGINSRKSQTPVKEALPFNTQPNRLQSNNLQVVKAYSGRASFYGEADNDGSSTALGDHYNENGMTASVPGNRRDMLGKVIRVTNKKTGKSVFVRSNDVGNFGEGMKYPNRQIDLSKGAARAIGISESQGVGDVYIEVTGQKSPKGKAGDALISQLNSSNLEKLSGVLGISENYDESGKPVKGKIPQYKFSTKLNSDVKVRKPSELAATVTESQQIVTKSNAQDEERQRQQAALDDKKAQDDIARTRNKAVNSLTDYSRELGLSYKATSRTVNDQEFNAIPYPTQEQRRSKEVSDTRKTFGDNRDNILKNIRDLQKPIGEAKKLLATVDLPENLKAPAQKALAEMVDKEEKYTKLLNKNNQLEIDNLDAIDKRFDYEQQQKSQKEKIEERQSSLQILQQRIQLLEKQKEINPYAKELDALPELKEQAALQEASIEYAQKLAELNNSIHDDSRSKESYQAQLDLYAKEHIAKAESIRLTRVQEERELSLLKIKRNYEKDSRFLNLDNTLKKSQTRRPDIQYEVADSEAYNSLQGAYLDINERKYDNPIDALRERSKNAQIYLQSRDQAELSKQSSKAQLQEDDYNFFTQPEIDSVNKKAEKMRDRGYTFEANKVSRDAGHAAEDFRYRQQLLDIETQIAEKRAAGQVISETEVDKLKDSLEEIHNFNLDDVDKQFKTFGETIDDVAKQAIGGLGDAIADLVTEGGDPLEKLNNIFNQILKSFISTGVNSLVSPLIGNLFGGMGKQQTAQSGLGLGNLFGGEQGLGGLFGSGGLGSIFSGIGSIFGLKKGGMVQNFAAGGDVRNSDNPIGLALRKEGSNSVLAALTPNERVLTVREAMAYNTLFPNGILESIKPGNFNDGGMVDSSPISQMIKQDSSINVGVTANIEDSGGGNMKEKQLVALIRSVVTAELNRQKSPGGILAT